MVVAMGSMCSNLKQRRQQNREDVVRSTSRNKKLPQPVITTDSEVMLIDFSRETFGCASLDTAKDRLPNYIPIDFRCCREKPLAEATLGEFAHSYVDALGKKPMSPLDELALCVDFTEDGIEVCLGQLHHLQLYKNRRSPIVEEFFFAEADTVMLTQACTSGFHEILAWVDAHRYKRLEPLGLDDEDRNLGRQLYAFIRGFYDIHS